MANAELRLGATVTTSKPMNTNPNVSGLAFLIAVIIAAPNAAIRTS